MDDVVASLTALVGTDRCSVSQTDREKYSHDASSHPHHLPDIVVWPASTKDVSEIMKIATTHKIPVTPYAAGSSLEGNPIPVQGGISMNMMRMNRLLEIRRGDFQIDIEPGILGDELNAQLAEHGLYFPCFPASSKYASLGGMISNNAGGMYAVRYGVVGDWVLALEVVLADGSIITTGSRSIKSVSGYDLKRLFIASEGTLGVITRATLKVMPSIQEKVLFLASFSDTQTAVDTTVEILHANIAPAAVEYLDEESVRHVNLAKSLQWTIAPTLIIELHGARGSLDSARATIESLVRGKSLSLTIARSDAEMEAIWQGRRAVHPSIMKSYPRAGLIPGDVGVPVSQIPTFVEHIKTLGEKYGVRTATFGHVGDGNFHVWIVYDLDNEHMHMQAQAANTDMVTYALSLGGTATAEHGIGIGKRPYLIQEHASSIPLMKAIKATLDPLGILNPGKIL